VRPPMSKASGMVKMMAPRKKVDERTRANHICRRRWWQARTATSLTSERCYCCDACVVVTLGDCVLGRERIDDSAGRWCLHVQAMRRSAASSFAFAGGWAVAEAQAQAQMGVL
jgi:hypothetical protein